MARLFSVVCLLALVLGAFVPAAVAQDDDNDDNDDDDVDVKDEEEVGRVQEVEDDEDEDEDDEDLTPSSDVTITYLFPQNADKRFPAGEKVELLFGFENNGDVDLNVTTITASLVVPQDYFYYVENYTSFDYNSIVKAGETQTFEYAFVPDETFDPREFGFTAQIEYNDMAEDEDDLKEWRSPIYNGTVDIVEPSDFTDTTTFFTYCAVLLVAALGAFIAYRFATGSSKRSKTVRRAAVETGTSSSKTMTSQEMEYLVGVIPQEKKKTTGAKSTGSKSTGSKGKASGKKRS